MAFRAVSATGVQGERVRGAVSVERKACSSPGGGRGWGSKKDFIEGGNLAFSFWLRISVQRQRAGKDILGCALEKLGAHSVAGTIGFGRSLIGLNVHRR